MFATNTYPARPVFSHPSLRPYGGSGDILLVRDRDEWGGDAHYFVRVSTTKRQRLLREIAAGRPIDLSRYGEVVYSAYGKEPSDSVRAWMQRVHGWEG